MQVSGILNKIAAKAGNTKGRDWTKYALCVEDGNGAETWYHYGFKKPDVTEGSYISFDAVSPKEGFYNVNGEVTIDKSRKAQTAVKVAQVTSDTRQNSIVRQNATSTAAAIVNSMVTLGVVKLPAKGKAFDAYLELVQDVANRIFLVNINPPTAEELQKQYGDVGDDAPEAEDTDDYWAEE